MGAFAFFRRILDTDAGLMWLARLPPRSPFGAAAIGLAAALLALAVRAAAYGYYGQSTGFMILLPGVILAALAGGRLAGFVALAACLGGGWLLVLMAGGSWAGAANSQIATTNFVIVGVFTVLVAASLRQVLSRLDDSQALVDEGERRFRDISDVAPVMLWSADAMGRLYVNAEFRRFWGEREMSMADLTHWTEAIHPDDRERVVAASQRALVRREPLEIEARYLRHDGEWRVLRTVARPRRGMGTGFMGMVGANIDVTEARAAEKALSDSEARFRLVADNIPNLAWMAEGDGSIYWYNQRWYDYTGTTPDQMEGWGWQSVQDPDLVDGVTERFKAAVANGDPWEDLFPLRSASGEWRWFLSRAMPIRGPDGVVERWFGTNTDVTAQREAEAAVRESEQRFRAVADTAPVLIWVTGPDRVREFVNQAYVAYNGGTYEDARLADWRDVIHPDDHARVIAESLAGEATAEPFSMEARYLRHDGEYRWLKSFSRPRLGAEGEVVGFVGVAFDVTDIRETNARLAASAAERDAILGQLGEGVIVTDPDGRIIFVNEAAVRHHGVARLDVAPDDYAQAYSLFTEDGEPYPPQDLPLARAVMKGETVLDARWRIRRPDGTEVLVIGNARPVTGPDGARIGAVLTLRDETARLQAERRLAESEARFRTVADTAPVKIWMSDETGRIVFANKRFRTFFGIKAQKHLADGWLKLVHPEDQTRFGGVIADAFKARERFEALARINHPTLGQRWLRTDGAPRFDAAGAFQGYVGASIDVTDAKRAQDDLERINELLEERVGDALAEKAKAEADLMHAQRLEAVGRLTGGVAHDFNNLLTVVIGALDIVLRSDDRAKQQKLAEAALAAARRGERLTHQLLAFSRRQALRPEVVDLNGLIREGEPLLRRAVGEAVEFKLKLKRGGARVSVDPAQFEAALLNLIVNARDAVGDTGRIVVQTAACSVKPGEIRELPPGDFVCVTVTDDGEGMAPELIGRVFEPFFTTKSVGKGTGLGLSQVYGFARQSGGGVHIESEVGRGTEIRLYLPPLAAEAVSEPESPRIALRPLAKGGRLLLVEDDPSVAAVALDLLTGFGLEVSAAETAPQALDILKGQTFDLMLSDVVMPGGMTGIELARTCARDYPAMRIILTSGYAGDDVDAALADAPWPFLRKPYSTEQLRRALDDLGSLPA